MAKFVTARRIKDLERPLWESLSVGKNLIVVATSAQKYFLKSSLLDKKNGNWGARIVTVSEYKRQNGYVLNFELSVILASRLKHKSVQQAQTAVKDFVSWMGAGHNPKKVPLPEPFKEELLTLYNEIPSQKTPWSNDFFPTKVILLGFGLVENDMLLKQNPNSDINVFAIEPNVLSGVQMSARASIEQRLGEAQMIDELPQGYFAVQTSSDNILVSLSNTLESYPQINRVIYKGDSIGAILGSIFKPTKPESDWWSNERLGIYKKAGSVESFDWILRFLRHEAIENSELLDILADIEKNAKDLWQDSGQLHLSLFENYWKALPAWESIDGYVKLTKQLWPEWDETSSQLRFLIPLQNLLPEQKLSREIWLSLMSVAAKEKTQYGSIWAVPVEESLGLLDDESLLLVGNASVNKSQSLLDIAALQTENKKQVEISESGEEILRGIWIERDSTTPPMQEYELTHRIAYCQMPEALEPVRYQNSEVININKTLEEMQKHRRSLDDDWGAFDYALDKFSPSCKQWEEVLKTPEVSWYTLQKLQPIWRASKENQRMLWIGNWVHAAMGDYPEQSIAEYFTKLESAEGSLLWRMALRSAREVAEEFASRLDSNGEYKTLKKEFSISGDYHLDDIAIPQRGRVDRLLESMDGNLLVLDFKTSPKNEKIGSRIKKGDGLQLWLYAALLKEDYPKLTVGVCRIGAGQELIQQKEYDDGIYEAQKRMKIVWTSKVLGYAAETWGEYGAQQRLPIATLPIPRWVVQKREEVTNDA